MRLCGVIDWPGTSSSSGRRAVVLFPLLEGASIF